MNRIDAEVQSEEQRLAARLLGWYDTHRRELPWRYPPGAKPDPYRVWLSEIMLQQTTVATGRRHFDRFVERWPSLPDLAAALLDDVLHAWQGLGYYARARNLHRCARQIMVEHGGCLPETEAELRTLPGVGTYTAAAIAAIAFEQPATPVDANVERVLSRLRGIEMPLPAARRVIAAEAARLTPMERPGDYVQAVMDLGALVCTPERPACARCPWADACVAHARGLTDVLPRRAEKAAKPTRQGVAFWARRADGRVLLRRRPENGLLGGMMEVPSTPWTEDEWIQEVALAHAPLLTTWHRRIGIVRHTFTHFHLDLTILVAELPVDADALGEPYVWAPLDGLDAYALPTVMKKVVREAMTGLPLTV